MRVLILSTPFDARARLDGSRRAVADLVAGLSSERLAEPTVLVGAGGEAPPGARGEFVGGRAVDAFVAALLAQFDVVHAWFSPRARTAAALRLVRAARHRPIVQTIASVPGSYLGLSAALCGDVVVPTSAATAIALATHGIDARALATVPAPFALEAGATEDVVPPPEFVLYAGDYEFDDGLERTLSAFAKVPPARGLATHLVVAARTKTAAARTREAAARRRVLGSSELRERVTFLGEVPSLLPWIASARAVLVPAATTYAKLDHPRVLLEAIALGVRVIVGKAPSLAELCDDPRVGEVAHDGRRLREALERAFSAQVVPSEAAARVLAPRSPVAVARRYAEIYARVTGRPR